MTARGIAAVGVDIDEQVVEIARNRWADHDFRVGVVDHLPLEDRSVVGYRADKIFHELTEPERALAEAQRVLVPGGRVVLLGQDWDTIVIDSDQVDLTRTIVHARASTIPNPQIARRYRNLLVASARNIGEK